MQKLKLKKKKKVISVEEQKTKSAKKLALAAVQKQLQLIKLKEWLVMAGFAGGAAILRAAMQPFPNIEPLTFFAVLSGWLFGKKKGFITGISALYISNFIVFGGQGPWTIYQSIGYGIAGFIGGFLRKKASVLETMFTMFIATIILQITFNLGWAFTMGFGIIGAFLTSIPFLLTHLISNTIFGIFLPATKRFIEKKGKFNEKEICEHVLNRFSALKHKLSKKH